MSTAIPDRPFLTRIGDLAQDLSVQAAVLDRFGVIVAVNEHWQRAGEVRHPTLPEFGRIGENYFRNCAFADPLSPRLIRGLSQVISGEIDRLSLVYSHENDNNGQNIYFLLLAFPHPEASGYIVVMHVDVTILTSVFTNYSRDAVPHDAVDKPLASAARPTAQPAGGSEQALLALIEEASKLGRPPHSQLQRKERHVPLSKRQTDVLTLMTKGLTNAEIAQELGLSLNTVKVYVSGILARLGLQSRAQVLHWALARHEDEDDG